MNLLLLDPDEVEADGVVILTGPRARHLRQVLGAGPGKSLRAGVLGQGHGSAQVETVDSERVVVRYRQERPCEQPVPRVLLLGMPRPKAFSRCLQHAAALGFTRILILGCQRVEKGHLLSGRLEPERLRADLCQGLEQGGHVHLPDVHVFRRFKPFVEDALEALVTPTARYVAHVGADPLSPSAGRVPHFALAVGPDGGFVPYEVELLKARGFVPFGSNVGALRVESALGYFTGQLDALVAAHFSEIS